MRRSRRFWPSWGRFCSPHRCHPDTPSRYLQQISKFIMRIRRLLLTDPISAGVLKHCLCILCKLLDRRIGLGGFVESNRVSPSADGNHDFGIGKLRSDGGDRNLGLVRGCGVTHGEGEDYMVDAGSIFRVRGSSRVPSKGRISTDLVRVGGSILVGVDDEAGTRRGSEKCGEGCANETHSELRTTVGVD